LLNPLYMQPSGCLYPLRPNSSDFTRSSFVS